MLEVCACSRYGPFREYFGQPEASSWRMNHRQTASSENRVDLHQAALITQRPRGAKTRDEWASAGVQNRQAANWN